MEITFIKDGDGIQLSRNNVSFQIWTKHSQSCCERVYAEWKAFEIENVWFWYNEKLSIEMITNNIELVEGVGFRLFKQFIPCYNIQNGYYGDDLTLCIKNLQTNGLKEIDIRKCSFEDII